MTSAEFINKYQMDPAAIDADECIRDLIAQMELGLEGKGNIPMIPSYLSLNTKPTVNSPCCILDAGGTNLRVARAVFDEEGKCRISNLIKVPMLGTEGEVSFGDFYGKLAAYVHGTGCVDRIGFCFSYNVELERTLDGILYSWCKEVKVPEATGKYVGASLRNAVGEACRDVRVLNDSTAALLGARCANEKVSLGIILGTGINICYSEQCSRIPKVEKDLKGNCMIISTEIGEYNGIPKTVFDRAVLSATDDPELAQAEKQCSGAYLGEIISAAWNTAAEEGLLIEAFHDSFSLPEISDYLAGAETSIPDSGAAREIAQTLICRGAKIAAILTAGTVVLSHGPGSLCTMVIEGSQFQKLTGFREAYEKELREMLTPHQISYQIIQVENSCLQGAALAAFAEPM